MIILADTRQKCGQHNNIETYCKANGIDLIPKALQVGDYMLPNGKCAVDTKASIAEMAIDAYTDKKSLNKKYRKCYEQGIKLIVLVEEEISSLQELCKWKSKHTKLTGRELLDMIHTLQVSYGIEFKFCKKENTGRVLVGLLTDNQAIEPRKQ